MNIMSTLLVAVQASSQHGLDTKVELENALRIAVEKPTEVYQNFFALHYRWDDDDTNAEQDEKSFHDLAKLLGFLDPESYVIPRDDVPPAPLGGEMGKLLSRAANTEGRSVVLFHYSGHGHFNDSGELMLSSCSGKTIYADYLLSYVIPDYYLSKDFPLDVVFIFDCGASLVATRKRHLGARRVDILSVGEKGDSDLSLTSKMLHETQKRSQDGNGSVEMAKLIEHPRGPSAQKCPSYMGGFGTGSVIPLEQQNSTLKDEEKRPGLMTTFSVHMAETLTDEELEEFVNCVHSISRSGSSGHRLECIKKTVSGSIIFIFEISRLCFSRIRGLPWITEICENAPVDFSQILRGNLL